MTSMKLKNILFWFYVAFVLVFEIGLLILVHYLLHVKLGQSFVRATVLVSTMAILIGWPTFKGLYAAFRIQFRGDSMGAWLDRIGGRIPLNPTLWYWLASPLLIYVFSVIYALPLALLAGLVSLPFGEAASRNMNSLIVISRILSFFFAFGTVFWIWRIIKSNDVRK